MTVIPLSKPSNRLVQARVAIFALAIGLALALAWISQRFEPTTAAPGGGTAAPASDREPANPAENR